MGRIRRLWVGEKLVQFRNVWVSVRGCSVRFRVVSTVPISGWPTKTHSSTLVIRGHLQYHPTLGRSKMSTERCWVTRTSRHIQGPSKACRNNYLSRIQMKWKKTFTTTTWDQHSVPLRRLQDRNSLNPSCPPSTKQMAHHVVAMRRLCSVGQNFLQLPLIIFQQPPLHLWNLIHFCCSWSKREDWWTYCRRSHPSHQKVEEWPCRWFQWYSSWPAEMCSRPCQPRLTLSIHPSLEIWHSPCWLARRHHNHSVWRQGSSNTLQ